MGLLGAPFAEEDGGFGGGAVETMIVMEQFGKALTLEPYLQTVVLCGALLKHGASDKQRAELIGAIAAGDVQTFQVGQAFHQSRGTIVGRNDNADRFRQNLLDPSRERPSK